MSSTPGSIPSQQPAHLPSAHSHHQTVAIALGVLGGLCVLAAAIIAAMFVVRRRRRQRQRQRQRIQPNKGPDKIQFRTRTTINNQVQVQDSDSTPHLPPRSPSPSALSVADEASMKVVY